MGKHDGGPAFPKEAQGSESPQLGMSLRDWFAGMILSGLCCHPDARHPSELTLVMVMQVAQVAYTLADAMLEEREKGPGRDA